MLTLAVGYGKNVIDAKERAIYFYEKAEGRKIFKFVETQPGYNEINESVWITTIWFERVELTEEEKKKQEEEHLFIGSKNVDPNDPNWREKLQALQAKAAVESLEETQAWELTTVQSNPTVAIQVERTRCEECDMHHEPHENSLCSK